MALADGLVAYRTLDEASGLRADSVGVRHLADHNSVGQAAGKVGQAADFAAASSQYLSLSDAVSPSPGDTSFTYAFWFRPTTSAAGGVRTLMAKGTGSDGEFYLQQLTDDTLRWTVVGGAGFNFAAPVSTAAVTPGTWYFVAVTHDAAGNEVGIGLDAGTPATAAHSAGVYDTTGDFVLGSYAGTGQYLDGRIDELGHWDRVLSGAELTDLYNAGAGRDYAYVSGGAAPAGQPAIRRSGGVPGMNRGGFRTSRTW